MNEPIELLQFPYSHYNEKARWALDWKEAPHRRTNLLPGPHGFTLQRLTGQTMVPVVRFGDELVCGSGRIIDELETRIPEPALYPAEPEARNRALEVQRHFDDVVGPLVRRSLFAILVYEPAYVCRLFANDRNAAVQFFYRTSFPLVRPLMTKSMGIRGKESIDEADQGTLDALDLVARESAATGYLAGDSFSVADLAAAALLAPAADPPDSPMTKPDPRPPAVQKWLSRWADHPGTKWVEEIYAKHRPPSAESLPDPG